MPWEGTRPRDPFVDGKGRVWFVGQEGNYVAYLEPKSGKFERYEIEEGTHPHNLVVAPDGMVWFTGNRNGRLVRLDPARPEAHQLSDARPEGGRSPHDGARPGGERVVHRAELRGGRTARREEREDPAVGDGSRHPALRDRGGRRAAAMVRAVRDQRGGDDRPGDDGAAAVQLPEGARPRRLVVTEETRSGTATTRAGTWAAGSGDGEGDGVRACPAGAGSLPYAMAGDDKGKIWLAESGRAAQPAGGVRSGRRAVHGQRGDGGWGGAEYHSAHGVPQAKRGRSGTGPTGTRWGGFGVP